MQELIDYIQRLLDCPELNQDELEFYTEQLIDEGQKLLNKYNYEE